MQTHETGSMQGLNLDTVTHNNNNKNEKHPPPPAQVCDCVCVCACMCLSLPKTWPTQETAIKACQPLRQRKSDDEDLKLPT